MIFGRYREWHTSRGLSNLRYPVTPSDGQLSTVFFAKLAGTGQIGRPRCRNWDGTIAPTKMRRTNALVLTNEPHCPANHRTHFFCLWQSCTCPNYGRFTRLRRGKKVKKVDTSAVHPYLPRRGGSRKACENFRCIKSAWSILDSTWRTPRVEDGMFILWQAARHGRRLSRFNQSKTLWYLEEAQLLRIKFSSATGALLAKTHQADIE